MRYFLVLLFFLFSTAVFGQTYYFSHQIDSLLKVDTLPWKHQSAAWRYSFIGDYFKAMEAREAEFPQAKPSQPTQEQRDLFQKYRPVEAKKAILQEAAKTRILIINEAHHLSRHRVFVSELLPELKKLGYQFIGMEGLGYEDSLLQQRKYPVLKSGFYTQEPCYGNLIRDAFELGYSVFPYEQVYSDSVQRLAGREKAEALNIKKVMDRNPSAKFIIYCGYDHVAEDTLNNFMGLPMAGQLKKLTGIDPFTVDQASLSEFYLVGNNYRRLMMERDSLSAQNANANSQNRGESFVFVDSNAHYFNQANPAKKVDCQVYHPATAIEFGRPRWLQRKNIKFVWIINQINIDYPLLVKSYLETDDIKTAVPVDVVELKTPEDFGNIFLYLNKKHRILVENPKGERQEIRIP